MKKENSETYRPGSYKEDAIRFFRQRVGDEMYQKVMEGKEEEGIQYVMAARVFLSQSDWETFCRIEQEGLPDKKI